DEAFAEMQLLIRSSGAELVGFVTQPRPQTYSKFLLGKGKITEATIRALHLGADILLFSCDLQPGQIKALASITDMKIVDRTQLILDVFTRRAHSRDGKLQVEL